MLSIHVSRTQISQNVVFSTLDSTKMRNILAKWEKCRNPWNFDIMATYIQESHANNSYLMQSILSLSSG